jgi:GT2 family glycosyltransferase
LTLTHYLQTASEIIAWLVALTWLWKVITAARGLPRVPNLLLPQHDISPQGDPSLTIIVPARDEAADIAATLKSLLNQDYPNLQIIAVNDRSTDSTGDIITTLAAQHPDKLRALHIAELPPGWLGKTHAMALAARQAPTDYLLFTDADVLFRPDALRRALAHAVATQADHLVLLPTTLIKTFSEGMLLGYLHVMSLWAVRPWRVSDPRALRDAVGVGAFNLLRTPVYQQVGGFDDLRMEIVEDLTLGRRIKQAGFRQRIANAPGLVSLHWASGAGGVVKAMTKNLFAIFAFRFWLVLLACMGIALICVAPAAFLAIPEARPPAILTWAAVAALYALSSRTSRISPWYAIFLPLSGAIIIYSILRSTFTTLKDGGVRWRGTFYPLAELRKNAAPLF